MDKVAFNHDIAHLSSKQSCQIHDNLPAEICKFLFKAPFTPSVMVSLSKTWLISVMFWCVTCYWGVNPHSYTVTDAVQAAK